MASKLSRLRQLAARVALVAGVALIAACGGGGSSAPPAEVDTTPPTIVSVEADDKRVIARASEQVTCLANAIVVTSQDGTTVVPGTTACAGMTATFIPGASPAPGPYKAVVANMTDRAGNPLATSATLDFTVAPAPPPPPPPPPPVMVTKVVVANDDGDVADVGGTGALSFIASNWSVSSRVTFPSAPGHLGCGVVDVDVVNDVVYCGGHLAWGILRTNLAGTPLPALTTGFDIAQSVVGLAHSETEVCGVFGRLGGQDQNPMRGVLSCWNRITGQPSFQSAVHLTAPAGYFPTGMIYSSTHKKFYVVSAAEASLLGSQVVDGYKVRPDYLPGTVGTLVEIDPVTHLVTGRWSVGSAPRGLIEVGNQIVVPNAGDGTFSVVTSGNMAVQTVDVSAKLTGLERLAGIATDGTTVYVGDYLSRVLAFRVADWQLVGQVNIGTETCGVGIPCTLAVADGKLLVPSYLDYLAFTKVNRLYVISLGSLTLESTLEAVGNGPVGVFTYQVPKP